MAEVESILVEDFFLRKQQAIIDAQSEKGLRASGVSASMLTVTQSGNITQLIDRAGYFEFQEFGRAPGKVPSWKVFYDWLAFKKYGKDWKDEAERKSMAWAILVNIKKKGTYLFRSRTQSGVLTEAINTENLDELKSQLAKARMTQILTDVQRIFK